MSSKVKALDCMGETTLTKFNKSLVTTKQGVTMSDFNAIQSLSSEELFLLATAKKAEEKALVKAEKASAKKALSRWSIVDSELVHKTSEIHDGETYMKWDAEQGEYSLKGELPAAFMTGFLPRPLFIFLVKKNGYTYEGGVFHK